MFQRFCNCSFFLFIIINNILGLISISSQVLILHYSLACGSRLSQPKNLSRISSSNIISVRYSGDDALLAMTRYPVRVMVVTMWMGAVFFISNMELYQESYFSQLGWSGGCPCISPEMEVFCAKFSNFSSQISMHTEIVLDPPFLFENLLPSGNFWCPNPSVHVIRLNFKLL